MFDLTGRNALVTGASGAIGGAIATALHAQGASVALSGTRHEALDALAAELGERAHAVPANLGDAEETEALPGRVEEALGDLHILVNNAGLTRDMLALRLSDDQWQSVIDVNLTATFRLSRAALRGMMRRRHGRIINIASIVGVTGNPGQANYAASKAGMIGMTKSMAAEVAARGVTLELHRAGLRPLAHDRRAERAAAGRPAGAHSGRTDRRARPTSPAPRSSWRATKRPGSPARRSTSTAGWRWCERGAYIPRQRKRSAMPRRLYPAIVHSDDRKDVRRFFCRLSRPRRREFGRGRNRRRGNRRRRSDRCPCGVRRFGSPSHRRLRYPGRGPGRSRTGHAGPGPSARPVQGYLDHP